MSPSEVNWLPPVLVLAVGAVMGLLLMLRLRSSARTAAAAPPGESVALRDLAARRDALIDELRELEQNAPKARAEEIAQARYALEIEAARVLMELDRLAAAPAPKAKRAEASAEKAAPAPVGGSTLAGFLWGVGSALALGLLVYFAAQASQKRSTGEGGAMGTSASPQATPGDPETERLRAAVEKNPEDLENRIALARQSLLTNDMMTAFSETRAVLERRPNDPRALTYQAVVRLAMGQTQMAEDMLKRALAATPDLEDAHVYLMLVYTETGRTAEADRALAEAAKRLPSQAANLKDILARMRAEVAQRGTLPQETGPNPHAGLGPGAPSEAAAPAAPATMAPAAPAPEMAPRAASTGDSISGVIELDPSIASRQPPTAVIWLLLRAAGQHAGPPLAVVRLAVAPRQPFTIGSANSMTGDAIPKSVSIEARLDADGNPATRDPGDPVADADNVAAGSSNLRLRLAPPR